MNQILLLLGLNVTSFSAGMKLAHDQSKSFEKSWRDMRRVFTAGGVATVMLAFLREFARQAQEARGKLEELGQPIPQGVQSLATMGDAMDGFGKIASTVVGFVLAGWKDIFDVIGSGVNRMRGISEAQENLAVAAAKAADMAEARLAKAREANSPEKIKAAEDALAKARHDHAYESASDEGKLNMLLEENLKIRKEVEATGEHSIKGAQARIDLEKNLTQLHTVGAAIDKTIGDKNKEGYDFMVKRAKAEEENDEKHQKYLFDHLDLTDQITELETKAAALQGPANKDIAKQVELDDVLTTLDEKRAALATQIAAAATAAAEATKKQAQTAEQIRDTYTQIFALTMGGHGNKEIQGANDAALQELQRRNNQQLDAIKGGPGRVNIGGGTDISQTLQISRLENENRRIQAELSERNKIRGSETNQGPAGARRSFSGDPLVFDRLVDQFSRTQDRTDKTNGLLEDLVKTNQGLPDQLKKLTDNVGAVASVLSNGPLSRN